ncbi:EAL domain-containing protein [Neorhizobium alkalisoli]|uniref:EAL domain-containing protein (Putative c-di-GMP-specific phosphodiesterase class I) n=1 Tax=Neorhizobium alkalisoli TaxID=528178 RepID=A0A561QVZ7_9HYPH|nr:EAL domain-containing protein [Neorhizobium alkalisoli]TWF54537.1 EAL domain-containing protein (putative c-di-GMP-specific phosphodiesterase class I) [Neorhizobium alkalisoli]
MTPKSIFANLIRRDDGSFSTAYGPFILQSALQPVFRSVAGQALQIEAFEGLVRTTRDNEPVAPGDFFALVDGQDIAAIDSIARTIHILNTGRLNRSQAKIFVKFQPGIVRTPLEMRQEVERIKLASHEAGLGVQRIVCEIRESVQADKDTIAAFITHMRDIGFMVAIDDYGAGQSDLELLKRIRPDYVKFEPRWVRDFLDNQAGTALLRVIVQQMLDDGIEPIIAGLEEEWQVEACEDLGVSLIQGYALARPELAPTSFDQTFPERPVQTSSALHTTSRFEIPDTPASPLTRTLSAPAPSPLKRARAFGKRNSGLL